MKKALKVTGIILLVLVIVLAATPFLFKGKLEDLLKKTVNNNLNAQVEWASLDLSLFRSFPDATVVVNDFAVINNAPFLGDTLVSGKKLLIEMGITQLFKSANTDPIQVDALTLDNAYIQIKVDKDGNTNYDITKETPPTDPAATAAAEAFVFDLSSYAVNDSKITYQDLTTNTLFELTEVNHKGSGDFSAIAGELDTHTEGVIALVYDGTNYLDGHQLKLDAVFQMDLENQKYTFKENSGFINELPLAFDGFIQLLDDATAMDITFKTPDSDFKNFLAVIPKEYRKNLDGVDTTGDFRVSGMIKGQATDTTIPQLDIAITSTNASFKYPDLPKRMNNINIDVKIKNDTGIADLTYVEINSLQFKIDDDLFSANGTLKNLTGNMLVNLGLKGALDLGNIEKVYPLDLETPLQGRLVADVITNFDMNAVEKHQYQNIKSSGTASLSNFEYQTPQLPNKIAITSADVAFNPGTIRLTKLAATTGKTDINATGTIENLIPFIMSKEDLKGRFDIASKVFDLNDFAAKETTSTNGTTKVVASSTESIQIPDFLDASLSFKADKVIYDNLELTNAAGNLTIKDEQASISGLKSGIFGGAAGLAGNVTTRDGVPTFDMSVDLSSIDIDQSFKQLDMMKGLAPIAKALQGALNTKINLQGKLDENLSPILSSISGNALAEILTADVNPEQMPLLNALDSKLNFIDLSNIKLDKLKTTLTFKDGNIVVKPFDFDVKGIKVNVSGGHSFSNELNYTLNLDVPASFLGGDVSSLLSKLTEAEKENLTVALPVSLSGNFTAPSVNLNLKAATTALTNQIIDIQKQRVKDKVEDKITGVLGGLLGGGNTPNNTTAQDSTATPATNSKPKPEDAIKDAAADILGGLFGGKKKTKETKKDSVN